MIELKQDELALVGGGLSGYEGAGAILAVSAFAISSPIIIGLAIGAGGGLALAQFLSQLR